MEYNVASLFAGVGGICLGFKNAKDLVDLADKGREPTILEVDNIEKATTILEPYAVDVSSGIETDGVKDNVKMAAFVSAVRKDERI